MTKKRSFYLGVDLGQLSDYTAVVVVERVDTEEKHEWHLRDCERLPLGTNYLDVAAHIRGKIRKLEKAGVVTLIVDSTGVGRPVVDFLKENELKPIPVTVTGGLNVSYDETGWRVPKRDLVSSAKVMLSKRELKIAKGLQFKDVLLAELQNFRVKVNIATGHDSYEAWREGEHDDLVFAMCLACWWALRKKKDSFSIDASEVVEDTAEGAILPQDDYRIAYVPARDEEYGAIAVFNRSRSTVVNFNWLTKEPIQKQIDKVFHTAERYDAAVRTHAGTDEATIKALSRRGASVRRIDLDGEKLRRAYENLSLLVNYKQIILPDDPELLAELEIGQGSGVTALCLLTYDTHPEIAKKTRDFGGYDEDEVHSWFEGFPPGWRPGEPLGKQIIDDEDLEFMY
jgi:hypothetical protein